MLELLNQLGICYQRRLLFFCLSECAGIVTDGFDARGEIKVIMATNRIETLDPALLRPGELRPYRIVLLWIAIVDSRDTVDCICWMAWIGVFFVVVFACTYTHTGRIDRKIEFPLPDVKTKRMIFGIHTGRMNLADDVDLEEFIMAKDELSGADIKVCH